MESIYESHPIGTVTRLEADLAAAAQRLEAVEAENARLTDIVKEAWRLWADMTGGLPISTGLDRGFKVVRIHPERYAAFDALFRTSETLEQALAATAAPDARGGDD